MRILQLATIFALLAIPTSAQDKIPLFDYHVYNLAARGDAGTLVDEQALAGDPANGSGGAPTTLFTAGYVNAALYHPLEVIVDLGVSHTLTDFYYFDIQGGDSMWVFAGSEGDWTPVGSTALTQYLAWGSFPISQSARYVRMLFKSPNTLISEIVLYGTPEGVAPPPPLPNPPVQPPMEDFIGINGFIDDPIDKLAAVGHVREYHQWRWDEGNGDQTYPGYPANENAWNPSWVSGPGWGWDFDTYYADLIAAGVEPAPVLTGNAGWMVGYIEDRQEDKPILDRDPADPASYIEHADHLYQYAARYGKTAVSPGLLKLKSDQEPLSGLGLLNYLENWNEQDKWWKGEPAYFSPIHYAAMASADYDGHLSSLGATIGMKNADPTIKAVMGGITELNIEYVRAMQYWSDHYRDGSLPADVLNFHHYSNDGGGQNSNPTVGVSPEEDGLKDRMKAIIDYRDRYLPNTEVWVSEFGYDTNQGSIQRAPAIGPTSEFEVQGQWIVRSYLALAAARVDRAQLYMLRDVFEPNPTRFSSSGLTGENFNGHQPKRSWYYVYTLKNSLKGTRFSDEVPSGNPNVTIYRFNDVDDPERVVYVLWCPTSNNTEVTNYTLSVGSGVESATLTSMQDGDTDGVTGSLSVASGQVSVDVSERPVFVTVSGASQLIAFDLRVELQGPNNGTAMEADVPVPANQPYSSPPWNYPGTETLGTNDPGIVDWILLEFRDPVSGQVAIRRAALVKEDGTVIGASGSSLLLPITPGSYDLLVRHRNHLAIKTAGSIQVN